MNKFLCTCFVQSICYEIIIWSFMLIGSIKRNGPNICNEGYKERISK